MWRKLKQPPWRTVVPGFVLLVAILVAYFLWSPGLDIRDGRHDRGRNGIWLQHGWLGADEWFIRNAKTNRIVEFRDPARIRALADKLRAHHVTDVFPHVSPASAQGPLPPVDDAQVARFLDVFDSFRVIPWTGGVNDNHVHLESLRWRSNFVGSIRSLLDRHPRLAGIQINVEPLRSGTTNFLDLLDELRGALPRGKIISIAAYPPPTRWQPSPEVHWDEPFFRAVARRCDQLAVMMYDTSLRNRKLYEQLMSKWTREILDWSEGASVLLGLPTYDDAGVGYHHPSAENLTNSLRGVHHGLTKRAPLPTNYCGVALYCEWEMDEAEWGYFRSHFIKP